MSRCFCVGYRETPESVLPFLEQVVEDMVVRQGVTEFVVGHYGNFDRLVCKAVGKIKSKYPMIRLTILLPFHPAKRKFEPMPEADDTWYPFESEHVPPRAAIIRANRKVIDSCQCLLVYVTHSVSNAQALVEYAKRKGHLTCIRNVGEKKQPSIG